MGRKIRLTGRRELKRSAFNIKLFEVNGKKRVAMTLANPKIFDKIPGRARIKFRLFENKVYETLNFGTLNDMKTIVEVNNNTFSAPSCQLRIVADDASQAEKGLLLASTNTWTLRIGEDEGGNASGEGILRFQPDDIAPRSWKLTIPPDDGYPIVRIDKRIPNSRTWVRTDPVFISCVLPAIIREIFDDIFSGENLPDTEWERDWITWADTLMPGRKPPWDGDRQKQQDWINDLLESFCFKHGTLDVLIGKLNQETET